MIGFSRPHKLLAVIIAIGVILRLAAALYFGNQVVPLPGTYDQVSYHELALRVLNGHGFSFGQPWWPATAAGAPTAHWSYLYTLYLSAVYKLLGPNPIFARLIQVLIVGVLQPLLAYLLGRRVFSELVGLLAATLTIIYTYFVYYSATLMTEPFYITAILASIYLVICLAESEKNSNRKLALGLGATLGAAVLLRQVFLLFVPFLLLWLIVVRHRRFGRFPIRSVFLVSAIIAICILPFTIYNYTRFERFVLLNTNAGYAFFWANHPIHGNRFMSLLPAELGSYADLIPVELRDLDEAALDQKLLALGIDIVRGDPARYVLLSLSRIPALFRFWPSAESGMVSNLSRVSSFGLLWPFMLFGFYLAIFRRKTRSFLLDPVLPLVLFVIFNTAIHLLSWSLIRYRLPIDAVSIIFAALAIVHILKRLKIRKLDHWAVQLLGS